MHTVIVHEWEPGKIRGAIVGTVYAAHETYALSVGPALLICHSSDKETSLLECTRYDLPQGTTTWTVSDIGALLKSLGEDDVFASPVDIAQLLPRLPNLNVSIATMVLGLIQVLFRFGLVKMLFLT